MATSVQLGLDLRPLARGRVQLPGSKSLSNRALLLAALAQGQTTITGLLDSDDTRVMVESLRRLGVALSGDLADSNGQGLVVEGAAGQLSKAEPLELFVGNSGLTIRTLLPAVVVAGLSVDVVLSGVDRMHERPIADLVDGLRALGASIDYLGQQGCPPLRVRPARLKPRERLRVRGNVSSQFLTGLMQVAPLLAVQWGRPVEIEVEGPLISRPYVDLSIHMLAQFGVRVEEPVSGQFRIHPAQATIGLQAPGQLKVEADASSASYFLAAGLLGGGPVRVEGVGKNSPQGDVQFAHALSQMGASIAWGDDFIEARAARLNNQGRPVVRAVSLNANAIPDAAMTLVAVALYAPAGATTRLEGIGSWRVKETDRIAAMANEARALGAIVVEGPDFIEVTAPAQLTSASIATYDDHRVAMSFALASFEHLGDNCTEAASTNSQQAGRSLMIQDPGCVAKTYPEFFEAFADVCAQAVPVVAIDGPTASGKGTVAALLAQRLGFHYLDSGAIYRLLALASQDQGLAEDDEQGLVACAGQMQLQFQADCVFLGGKDVSLAIRAEAIGNRASRLAALPRVRQALLRRQRDFARPPGLVADGRDMASVVFPHAQLKIFLTASAEVRAQRRYNQLKEKGIPTTLEGLLADLLARDERDSNRAAAPLRFLEGTDMVFLDTSEKSVSQAVEEIEHAFATKAAEQA
ncbi:MAG: 3-phosphoshikimate 1-carboxyvinyltransferase [Burkholderiaceae bacterium]